MSILGQALTCLTPLLWDAPTEKPSLGKETYFIFSDRNLFFFYEFHWFDLFEEK